MEVNGLVTYGSIHEKLLMEVDFGSLFNEYFMSK